MTANDARPRVAIACGGTGGHLYPGLAVARQLLRRSCAVTLLISAKEVDQQAVKSAAEMDIVTLPAVGLTRGKCLDFLAGFLRSYRKAKEAFQSTAPKAALAMGGFTSAPPLLAARHLGARTFLHESNAIPGRANRWLSWLVDRAFIGFDSAARGLHTREILATGTPVREQFYPRDPAVCRCALGLDPGRQVVLVMGGSQGASGLNRLVMSTLPELAKAGVDWQWLHLTGQAEVEVVRSAYSTANLRAVVHSFFAPMELALGAATVAVSRAGASSMAELAATRLPAVLVPYPVAVDNHQFYNARAFAQTDAACLLPQAEATPEQLAQALVELTRNPAKRQKMQHALEQWHFPAAAEKIVENILETSGITVPNVSTEIGKTSATNSESPTSLNHPPVCDSSNPLPGSDHPRSQRKYSGSIGVRALASFARAGGGSV
jgi:UDP-N-acetylglucosamine--N-acetylmuramyl-(pentapeptide) pyrophosphoryl-undecaprenol N-acetylglucosamine transferase